MSLFPRKPPWYVAGLAFECRQCGQCCAGPEEGYVWVSDEEIVAIARFLGLTADQVRQQYLQRVSGRYTMIETPGRRDCVFLKPAEAADPRGCAIYPVRPTQCRTWPFWDSNLMDPDCWAEACARCAGISRGRVFNLDEIEVKRRATRA